MKKKVTYRTIKTGPKATPKRGIYSLEQYTSESVHDFDERLKRIAMLPPEETLQEIIEVSNELLSGLPEEGKWHIAFNDRTWEYLPDNYKTLSEASKRKCRPRKSEPAEICNFISSPSRLIEPLSPQYFAAEARFNAECALADIERGDLNSAIGMAMNAIDRNYRRIITELLEPSYVDHLYRTRKREEGPKTGGRPRIKWADELAADLRRRYKGESFEYCWQRLDNVLPNVYDHYRVEIDGDILKPSHFNNLKKETELKKENFKQTYFYTKTKSNE